MKKLQNSASNITRTYLKFLDENGYEITLTFRSESSLNKFIDKNKQYKITYLSTKRPQNLVTSPSKLSVYSAIEYFEDRYKEVSVL